jgi:hypothetical protein
MPSKTSSAVAYTAFSASDALTMLSPPATTALVGYVILLVLVLLPISMYTYDQKTNTYKKQAYSFSYRLLIALLLLFPFALSVYSVNCMMIGDCQLWSWVVALLTLIWSIVITVSAFSSGSFALDELV